MCSAIRTFQGQTALSEMLIDQGVPHTVPILEAFAYLCCGRCAATAPDDDMCGVWTNQVFPHPRVAIASNSIVTSTSTPPAPGVRDGEVGPASQGFGAGLCGVPHHDVGVGGDEVPCHP